MSVTFYTTNHFWHHYQTKNGTRQGFRIASDGTPPYLVYSISN